MHLGETKTSEKKFQTSLLNFNLINILQAPSVSHRQTKMMITTYAYVCYVDCLYVCCVRSSLCVCVCVVYTTMAPCGPLSLTPAQGLIAVDSDDVSTPSLSLQEETHDQRGMWTTSRNTHDSSTIIKL